MGLTNTIIIPQATIICLWVSTIIAAAVPIILLCLVKSKLNPAWFPLLAGACTYATAIVLLSPLPNTIFMGDNLIGNVINANPLILALYSASITALFEVGGKAILFKYCFNKYQSTDNAVMAGIGYGVVQTLFIYILPTYSTAALLSDLNTKGSEQFFGAMAAESAAALMPAIQTLAETNSLRFLMDGVQGICVFIFQMSTCVLLYFAVTKKDYRMLIPITLLAHLLFALPSTLFQAEILTSLILVEVILIFFAATAAAFTFRIYRSEKRKENPGK